MAAVVQCFELKERSGHNVSIAVEIRSGQGPDQRQSTDSTFHLFIAAEYYDDPSSAKIKRDHINNIAINTPGKLQLPMSVFLSENGSLQVLAKQMALR
jgi:hypothetical protein